MPQESANRASHKSHKAFTATGITPPRPFWKNVPQRCLKGRLTRVSSRIAPQGCQSLAKILIESVSQKLHKHLQHPTPRLQSAHCYDILQQHPAPAQAPSKHSCRALLQTLLLEDPLQDYCKRINRALKPNSRLHGSTVAMLSCKVLQDSRVPQLQVSRIAQLQVSKFQGSRVLGVQGSKHQGSRLVKILGWFINNEMTSAMQNKRKTH